MLADPAQPGVARERLLEHGGAVGEGAITSGPGGSRELPGESRQTRAQHTVVVPAERIPRHVGEPDRRAPHEAPANAPAGSSRAACPARVPRAGRACCRVAPCSLSAMTSGRQPCVEQVLRNRARGRRRRSRPSESPVPRPSLTLRASAAKSGSDVAFMADCGFGAGRNYNEPMNTPPGAIYTAAQVANSIGARSRCAASRDTS